MTEIQDLDGVQKNVVLLRKHQHKKNIVPLTTQKAGGNCLVLQLSSRQSVSCLTDPVFPQKFKLKELKIYEK